MYQPKGQNKTKQTKKTKQTNKQKKTHQLASLGQLDGWPCHKRKLTSFNRYYPSLTCIGGDQRLHFPLGFFFSVTPSIIFSLILLGKKWDWQACNYQGPLSYPSWKLELSLLECHLSYLSATSSSQVHWHERSYSIWSFCSSETKFLSSFVWYHLVWSSWNSCGVQWYTPIKCVFSLSLLHMT